jgi:hypothetical protein
METGAPVPRGWGDAFRHDWPARDNRIRRTRRKARIAGHDNEPDAAAGQAMQIIHAPEA